MNATECANAADKRKIQLAMAKRRFRFKSMVEARIAKGVTYSLPMDSMVDLYMAQPEEERVQSIAFLRSLEADAQFPEVDTQISDDADAQSPLVDAQVSPISIPVETSRHDLVEHLVSFFKARALPQDTVRGTMLEVSQKYSPMKVEDLPSVISDILKEIPTDFQGLANALLGGLRKADHTDTRICYILDLIAAGIRQTDRQRAITVK